MISTAPVALLSAVVLLAFGRHARQGRTPLNRQLMAVTVFGMVVQATFALTYYRLVGDLGRLAVPILSGYWFLLSGAMAAALLPSIWPTSLAYLLCALGALRYPEYRYGFAALGNAVLCVNAVVVFRHQRKPAGG